MSRRIRGFKIVVTGAAFTFEKLTTVGSLIVSEDTNYKKKCIFCHFRGLQAFALMLMTPTTYIYYIHLRLIKICVCVSFCAPFSVLNMWKPIYTPRYSTFGLFCFIHHPLDVKLSWLLHIVSCVIIFATIRCHKNPVCFFHPCRFLSYRFVCVNPS